MSRAQTLAKVVGAGRLRLAEDLIALRADSLGLPPQGGGLVLEGQLDGRVVTAVEERPEDGLALAGVGLR